MDQQQTKELINSLGYIRMFEKDIKEAARNIDSSLIEINYHLNVVESILRDAGFPVDTLEEK